MAPSKAAQSKPCLPRLENGLLDVTPTGDYIAITERNSIQSPLLRLPAEIRNQIFEYILCGHTIRPCADVEKFHDPKAFHRPEKYRFSLPRVSRQIYSETAMLIYTQNIFTFLWIDDLEIWFRFLYPEQMTLKGNIRFIKSGIRICESYTNPSIRSWFPFLLRIDFQPYVFEDEGIWTGNTLLESFGDTKHVREVCRPGKWWRRWWEGRD